jgi:hypothetical protein
MKKEERVVVGPIPKGKFLAECPFCHELADQHRATPNNLW